MKRVVEAIIAGLLFSSVAFAGVCDNVSLSRIMPYMPADYRVVSTKPLKDANLCDMLIEIDGKLFTIYANSKIAIAGSLFKSGRNLSAYEINSYLAKRFKRGFKIYSKRLEDFVVGSYMPKGVKSFVYLVCDPLNPYCESIKSNLKSFAEKEKIGIKLIFVGVSERSKREIGRFICNRKDFNDYLKGDYGDNNTYCKKAEGYVESTDRLIFDKLGVKGLPLFITVDGKYQSGMNLNTLKSILKKGSNYEHN